MRNIKLVLQEIFVHSSSLNGNIISEDDRVSIFAKIENCNKFKYCSQVIFDLELGEKVTAINVRLTKNEDDQH